MKQNILKIMASITSTTESWNGHAFSEVESHIKGNYALNTTRNFTAGGGGWTVYAPYTTEVNLDNIFASQSHSHSFSNITGSISEAQMNAAINNMSVGESLSDGNDYIVTQSAGGGTSDTNYYRRSVNRIVNSTVVKAALGVGSDTSKYLRNDGTWATPSGGGGTWNGGNVGNHIYLTGAVENSSTSNTSQIVFGTSSNNHVCISSNKNAIIINPTINSTSNQMELGVNGHYSIIAGDLTVNGGVTSLSDIRKKDVIGDAELSIDDIASAPLIKFTWKEFKDRGEQVGTIAQYWEKILPQVIVERHDYLNLDYGVAGLISSITTAREVVQLKDKIKTLEARIKELENNKQ